MKTKWMIAPQGVIGHNGKCEKRTVIGVSIAVKNVMTEGMQKVFYIDFLDEGIVFDDHVIIPNEPTF